MENLNNKINRKLYSAKTLPKHMPKRIIGMLKNDFFIFEKYSLDEYKYWDWKSRVYLFVDWSR